MSFEPEPYAVYVLECDSDLTRFEAIHRAKNLVGADRWWVYGTLASERAFYVGGSFKRYNLKGRLKHHILRESKCADYTRVFQPKRLEEVRWFQNPREASRSEEETAREFDKRYPNAFVYQY